MTLLLVSCCCDSERPYELYKKENNLDAADYRESCQKPHSASDETKLCIKLDLLVSFYLVKGCRVKVDLNQVERGLWSMLAWKRQDLKISYILEGSKEQSFYMTILTVSKFVKAAKTGIV